MGQEPELKATECGKRAIWTTAGLLMLIKLIGNNAQAED